MVERGGAGYKVTVPETGKDCDRIAKGLPANMGEVRVTSQAFYAELNKRNKECKCSTVDPNPPPAPAPAPAPAPPPAQTIGKEAYMNSDIKTITISTNVTAIGESAFKGSKLTSITIPDSVTVIKDSAFHDCEDLSEVKFGPDPQLQTIGNKTFKDSGIKTITIPARVTSIGMRAFGDCEKLTTATFSPGSQLQIFEIDVFTESGITSITIPDSVTVIKDSAFKKCRDLSEVKFGPDPQLTRLEKNAFSDCPQLKTFQMPDSVTSVGEEAFGCPSDVTIECSTGRAYKTGVGCVKSNRTNCVAGTYLVFPACVDCPFPGRCLGNTECSTGSVGVACAECDLSPANRHYASNGECAKCPKDGNWAVALVMGAATVAFLAALHHFTAIKPEVDAGAVKTTGSICAIAFGHFQLSVHIFCLPALRWPLYIKEIMEFLKSFAFISFADMARPECQDQSPEHPAELFAIKFFLKQLLFVGLVGVYGTMMIAAMPMFLDHPATVKHCINSMVALFSVCFLLLVRASAAIFDCSFTTRTTPAQEGVCEGDPSTNETSTQEWSLDEFPAMGCWGDEGPSGDTANTWLGVATYAAVSLILFGGVVPTLLCMKLMMAKRAGTLVDDDIKASFGWMFLRYKYHVCAWYEFAVMGRKAAVLLVGMFFSTNPWVVTILTILVLGAFLYLHHWAVPYADHTLDHADEDSHDRSEWTEPDKIDQSTMISEIAVLVLSLYFSFQVADAEPDKGFLFYAFSIAAVIAALWPLGLSVYCICVELRAKKEGGDEKEMTDNPLETFEQDSEDAGGDEDPGEKQ